MTLTRPRAADVPRRLLDPDLLLKPARLQSLPASRISAGRSLLEKMQREEWTFERVAIDIDERSEGEALYRVRAGDRWVFDFVVFSFEPTLHGRTGRITGQNWDMRGALIEGPTTAEDRAITRAELPKLYAGRAVPGTLPWARSNRSFRAFDHTVEARLPEVTAPDLKSAWADILRRARLVQHHRISREELSVREYMTFVLRKLQDRRFAEFEELFDLEKGQAVVVVTFIALLELARESLIEITQAEAFAPIYVRLAYLPS